jgi:uncharacterized protein (DUF427 family)
MSANSVPNDKPVKIPGPDHPITIERHHARVIVMAGGQPIADTHDALTLREARYPAVLYIPRHDVCRENRATGGRLWSEAQSD